MRTLSIVASAALSFAAVATAAAQSANDIVVEIRNFVIGDGAAVVTLAVTNRTSESVKNVMIECGFMSEDNKALNVGYRIIGNIKASETGSEQLVALADPRTKKTNCRVFSVF